MTEGVIYKIENLITGKIYIGQTMDFNRRRLQYKWMKGKGQPKLFRSIEKHGLDNHIFSIIEQCSCQYLNEREQYWISVYNSWQDGLNCSAGGSMNLTGFKWSNSSIFNSKRKVYKCDIEGNIITVYHGMNLAIEREGKRIRYYGERNITINGHVFLSESQIEKSFSKIVGRIKSKNTHRLKPVYQINSDGSILNSFSGVREAYRVTGIDHRSISQVAAGSKVRKTAGGYKWSYLNPMQNVA